MKTFRILSLLIITTLILGACGPTPTPQVIEKEVVVTKEVDIIGNKSHLLGKPKLW